MRLIRVVLFDFWDTLILHESHAGQKLKRIRVQGFISALTDAGFSVSQEAIEQAMEAVDAEYDRVREETGRDFDTTNSSTLPCQSSETRFNHQKTTPNSRGYQKIIKLLSGWNKIFVMFFNSLNPMENGGVQRFRLRRVILSPLHVRR